MSPEPEWIEIQFDNLRAQNAELAEALRDAVNESARRFDSPVLEPEWMKKGRALLSRLSTEDQK